MTCSVFTSATEWWDVWRMRGVDGRRLVSLQDLHSGVSRWLPEGAGLPACRGPAGDERYSPHCHWLELLLLCKSAQLTATTTCWTRNSSFHKCKLINVYQKIDCVGFSVNIFFTGLWVIEEYWRSFSANLSLCFSLSFLDVTVFCHCFIVFLTQDNEIPTLVGAFVATCNLRSPPNLLLLYPITFYE